VLLTKESVYFQSLTTDLSEGSQRLAESTKAGEGTLSSTSASGQTKIRQELHSVKRDFDEYRTQLMEAEEDLVRCLSRWNDFEDSYNQFNNWLKETETYLRSDLEMKGSVEDKKKHWDVYQVSKTTSLYLILLISQSCYTFLMYSLLFLSSIISHFCFLVLHVLFCFAYFTFLKIIFSNIIIFMK